MLILRVPAPSALSLPALLSSESFLLPFSGASPRALAAGPLIWD
jgi:hypothetical protein